MASKGKSARVAQDLGPAPGERSRLYDPAALAHPDFPIGCRVRLVRMGAPLDGQQGEIIGVAGEFPVCTQYIVLLDEPFRPGVKWPGGPFRGLSVMGACLEAVGPADEIYSPTRCDEQERDMLNWISEEER